MSTETQVTKYHERRLFVALELASGQWKLATTDGRASSRVKSVPAFDESALGEELARGRRRVGLPGDAPVSVVMEAGRDGFSVHRWLKYLELDSIVIDPASVAVSRQKRRAKTDRLDAVMLVMCLVRYELLGEQCFRVCKVPSEEAEDRRELTRERERLVKERTSYTNRIKGQLAKHGVSLKLDKHFAANVAKVRDHRGWLLKDNLVAGLRRAFKRLTLVNAHIKELEVQLKAAIAKPSSPTDKKAALMCGMKGIGPITAMTLAVELFGWRQFDNRQQVGSSAGLTPTPYNTGASVREQGISKAGNARVRRVMIEAAWSWLRYQPDSALSAWFNTRFGPGSKRKGIVALARKLLIELWRLCEHGVIPEGALEKKAS